MGLVEKFDFLLFFFYQNHYYEVLFNLSWNNFNHGSIQVETELKKCIGSSLWALLSNFVIKLHGNRSSKLPLCEAVWKFQTCFCPNQSKPSNIARFYMSEKLSQKIPFFLTKIFFRKLNLISTLYTK